MEKVRFRQYLAYFTIILILLSVLPSGAFAAKGETGHENGNSAKSIDTSQSIDRNKSINKNQSIDRNQFLNKNQSIDRNQSLHENQSTYKKPINFTSNGTYGWADINNSSILERGHLQEKVRDMKEEKELKKEELKEQLQSERTEYQAVKNDFLQVRKQLHEGSLDPDSEEVMNATRRYLNSSLEYMIAQLVNVRGNIEASNGNGTQNRVTALNEQIYRLQAERENVENASTFKDFELAATSVRGAWNNSRKVSLTEAGQTVSEQIEDFLEKSDNLSANIETSIEALNENGTNTTELEGKLADYEVLVSAAKEKKNAADAIHEDENATVEELEEANNYLREALSDINEAKGIVKEIFGELKDLES